MELQWDHESALALLDWQVELGADEAIGETPVNRYEAAPATAAVAPRAASPAVAMAVQATPRSVEPSPAISPDPVEVAKAAAAAARTLDDLRAAIDAFELCELRKGARNLVFGDGNARARVLVLGEAPGREEDLEGRPFVGQAGQLLDRMFDAIGLSRSSPDPEAALYITNVLPWRPPGNREPTPEEIAMMAPFVARHVELVDPDIVVAMGNTPCHCLLGQRGILRLRGNWSQALGRPVLPMTHPAYLLRTPAAKREAWADLLALKARLGGSQ